MPKTKQNILKSYHHLLMIMAAAFASALSSFGQHYLVKEFNDHLRAEAKSTDSIYYIETGGTTTGMVMKIEGNNVFTGAYIILENDTLFLTPDEDSDASELNTYSNLLNFSPPIFSFYFSPGSIQSPVTFYFINAQTTSSDPGHSLIKKKSEDCSEPEMIDQLVWRDGLTEPNYERIFNVVHNVIIHHSAGSNTDTDYINVIRNIYIYHTEIRGWSDIGYNYLIAQDGTIFKGRDPGSYQQDEVLGAHFCNSNTGTLGICVMGTYVEIQPPDTAIGSLINLVTWIMGKDSLNPIGSYSHPLNDNLPALAGHRDGCSTECPGDSLYFLLDSIRNEAMAAFTLCGYTIKPVSIDNTILKDIHITQSKDEITFIFDSKNPELIVLTDILGIKRKSIIPDRYQPNLTLHLEEFSPGLYFASIYYDGLVSTLSFSIF